MTRINISFIATEKSKMNGLTDHMSIRRHLENAHTVPSVVNVNSVWSM